MNLVGLCSTAKLILLDQIEQTIAVNQFDWLTAWRASSVTCTVGEVTSREEDTFLGSPYNAT